MADTKTTPEFKEMFLGVLENIPNITAACKLLEINNSSIFRARKSDPEFDAAISEAMNSGYDMIEEEARRRAVEGVLEPVYYKGEQVLDANGNPGGIRKYSDRLILELLRAYKPKRFNPGVKLGMGGGEKFTLTLNLGGD